MTKSLGGLDVDYHTTTRVGPRLENAYKSTYKLLTNKIFTSVERIKLPYQLHQPSFAEKKKKDFNWLL